MSNRLSAETSPYLLQHAENPVDWWPWSPEALAHARERDKPIFLSVGYSACHWCHVMEHESFEDEATAEVLNREFVSIKVDREERPDVDSVYMRAVQALTDHGGWPMSVFLTTDGEPFYAGTYFPDTPRHGMPSFTQVLEHIAELWNTRKDELLQVGRQLSTALSPAEGLPTAGARRPIDASIIDAAMPALARAFDATNGGWGGAPKFPQPVVLEFVLRRGLATGDKELLGMVEQTLTAMARGGIYDQLGGGFHRYSVDAIWLVPHFEKMLYDNAQLARVYTHAWLATRDPLYRRIAEETLDYLLREMRDESGGFYSAQDADSEGEEGRYFVWTPDELAAALQAGGVPVADVELVQAAFGVTERGNFEGRSILFAAKTAEEIASERGLSAADVDRRLAAARSALLEARSARVRPATDTKVLAAWNGLALAAFSEAAVAFRRDDYRAVAVGTARFVLGEMRDADGRLLRTWSDGRAKLPGYLEDYANVADGLLALYQATFDPAWFRAARELADHLMAHFGDPKRGFYDTSDDAEELIFRPKETQDGAVPSGGSVAAMVLAKLAAYTGDGRYAECAEEAVGSLREELTQVPLGFANWLSAVDYMLGPPSELAIVGTLGTEELLAVVSSTYRPNLVVACGPGNESPAVPLLANREQVDGRATAYLCRAFTCEPPVTDARYLEGLLSGELVDAVVR